MKYLYEWVMEMHGMREIGAFGFADFTPPFVESWARMTGRDLNPLEFESLIRLGRVILHPEVMEPNG